MVIIEHRLCYVNLVRSRSYNDIFATPASRRARKTVPRVFAELGTVLEDARTEFCGAITRIEQDHVVLEDNTGRERAFPYHHPDFLIDGQPATLAKPSLAAPRRPAITASGSRYAANSRARTAQASRIWVEGIHDAELIERIWGHDLRAEGIVVEPIDGVDELPARVDDFHPTAASRIGVLVDHLVEGSKEFRLSKSIRNPHVLITGHPYIDIWQAVRPTSIGLTAWPKIPRGTPWKEGICEALNWENSGLAWQRVLSQVHSYRDIETPLINAVEQLIDFVTVPDGTAG